MEIFPGFLASESKGESSPSLLVSNFEMLPSFFAAKNADALFCAEISSGNFCHAMRVPGDILDKINSAWRPAGQQGAPAP
jgi:hypothetical protein